MRKQTFTYIGHSSAFSIASKHFEAFCFALHCASEQEETALKERPDGLRHFDGWRDLLKGIDGCSSGPIRFSHTGMKIAGNIRVLGGGSIADVNVVGGGSRWMRQYIICTAGEIQTEEKIGLSPASSKSPTRWRVL